MTICNSESQVPDSNGRLLNWDYSHYICKIGIVDNIEIRCRIGIKGNGLEIQMLNYNGGIQLGPSVLRRGHRSQTEITCLKSKSQASRRHHMC